MRTGLYQKHAADSGYNFRIPSEELQVEKVHIFRHDQSGTYRIHKFQNASYEEDETGYKAAEAFEA